MYLPILDLIDILRYFTLFYVIFRSYISEKLSEKNLLQSSSLAFLSSVRWGNYESTEFDTRSNHPQLAHQPLLRYNEPMLDSLMRGQDFDEP